MKLLTFNKKKLLRLYPLFILSGFLFCLIGYSDKYTFLKCLLGVALFIPPYPRTLWFVCMMLIFYFITPLILNKDDKRSVVNFLAVELIFFLLSYIGNIDKRLYYYWIFYGIGLLLRKNVNKLFVAKNYMLVFVAIILYIMIGKNIGNNFGFLTIIGALSFVYAMGNISYMIFGRKSDNKIITFISYLSMCVYLFHRPLYYCANRIFGEFNWKIAVLVCIPFTIAISWVIQKMYDKGVFYLKYFKFKSIIN